MTVEEAIKSRIDRFNRLYLKATGHTFEEEPEIFKKKEEEEIPIWQEKVNKYLLGNGYNSLEDFYDSIVNYDNNWLRYNWDGHEEFLKLLNEEPSYHSNYNYEMFCINQAKEIANWLISKGNPKELWLEYITREDGTSRDYFEFTEKLQSKGFDKWENGHSGNTGNTSVLFADFLIHNPEMFQYLHGALSPICGDKGYYDDRSDVPKE